MEANQPTAGDYDYAAIEDAALRAAAAQRKARSLEGRVEVLEEQVNLLLRAVVILKNSVYPNLNKKIEDDEE